MHHDSNMEHRMKETEVTLGQVVNQLENMGKEQHRSNEAIENINSTMSEISQILRSSEIFQERMLIVVENAQNSIDRVETEMAAERLERKECKLDLVKMLDKRDAEYDKRFDSIDGTIRWVTRGILTASGAIILALSSFIYVTDSKRVTELESKVTTEDHSH